MMAYILLGLLLSLTLCECKKVLFFMPVTAKSSQITWHPLAVALGNRGHDVTTICPYKSGRPHHKIREIVLDTDFFNNFTNELSKDILSGNMTHMDLIRRMSNLLDPAIDNLHETFSLLKKIDFFNNDTKYDVTVVAAMGGNEPGYYVSHRFNSSLVLYFQQQISLINQDFAMGQPHNPAVIPSYGVAISHPLTFWQRVGNTLVTGMLSIFRDVWLISKMEAILDEHFPEDKGKRPSLLELEKEAALAFQFGHPLLMDGLRPTSPNYIMIGMMNCRPPQPLRSDLQKFMDESGEAGVILVSFGSVLQASLMSDDLRSKLVQVFGQLKQRVLWKWESEEMAGKPANVKLSKWLPQQDILGHPKLRLFVTHGGQSSSQEALCHKKPVVLIPVFGDQPANAYEAERRGYGISIPLSELTSDKLLNAIQQMLHDPSYSKRAQEHGLLVQDQMTAPLERAVWWVEYAMRYPGMKHMRSPLHDLHWAQYFLLDVMAFLALSAALLIFLIYFTCTKCCCCSKSRKEKIE